MEIVPVAITEDKEKMLLSDGSYIPVTQWFFGGEHCEPEEATELVGGPDKTGHWYGVHLDLFMKDETIH